MSTAASDGGAADDALLVSTRNVGVLAEHPYLPPRATPSPRSQRVNPLLTTLCQGRRSTVKILPAARVRIHHLHRTLLFSPLTPLTPTAPILTAYTGPLRSGAAAEAHSSTPNRRALRVGRRSVVPTLKSPISWPSTSRCQSSGPGRLPRRWLRVLRPTLIPGQRTRRLAPQAASARRARGDARPAPWNAPSQERHSLPTLPPELGTVWPWMALYNPEERPSRSAPNLKPRHGRQPRPTCGA